MLVISKTVIFSEPLWVSLLVRMRFTFAAMQPETEWLFKKAQISHLELSLLEVHKFLSLRFRVQWLKSVGVQGCGLGFRVKG